MGLKEQIEKDEAELKKLEGEEGDDGDNNDTDDEDSDGTDAGDGSEGDNDGDDTDTDDEDGEDGEDDKGTKKPDPKADPKADKGKKPDPKADPKDDKGNPDARLRAERKKRLKLEEELAALKAPKPTVLQPQAKPAQTQDQPKAKVETAEQKLDRIEREREQERQTRDRDDLHRAAVEEFNDIEKSFAAETPDYEQASAHMIGSMFKGIQAANPGISEKQAIAHVQRTVLGIASRAVQKGQNPAEVLYQMSFDSYGFEGAKKAPAKADDAARKLQKIAQNKKRSASPFAGGGQNTGARATIEEGVKMNLADFGNLSENDIDEMINNADS